jgi:hypothetical protein
MIRNVLAIVAGIAVAMATFMLFEELSHQLHPVPANFNLKDETSVKNFIANTPVSSFLMVLAGYIVGSVFAGFVIRLISNAHTSRPATIAGGFLTLAAIINFYQIPHPHWFMAVCIVVFIPGVYIGNRLKKKQSAKLS